MQRESVGEMHGLAVDAQPSTPASAGAAGLPLGSYLEAFDRIEGMFARDAALMFLAYNQLATDRHMAADVLEIGVHRGLSAILVAAMRGEGRRFVAIDLFGELQDRNISASGLGNRLHFVNAMRAFFTDLSFLHIVTAASGDLTSSDLGRDRSFSFCHVDGGHSPGETYHDLSLCSRLLAPDGLLALDDYFNPLFPGVAEGAIRFRLDHASDFRPLAIGHNKVLFQREPAGKDLNAALLEEFPKVPTLKARLWDAPVLVFGSSLRPFFDIGRSTVWRLIAQKDVPIRATIEPMVGTLSAAPGGGVACPVRVVNTSLVTFQSGAAPIGLSYHLRTRAGATLRFDNPRQFFHDPLAPGAERTVVLTIMAPDEPGSYEVEIDLVWEGITWFKSEGNLAPVLPLDVG